MASVPSSSGPTVRFCAAIIDRRSNAASAYSPSQKIETVG